MDLLWEQLSIIHPILINFILDGHHQDLLSYLEWHRIINKGENYKFSGGHPRLLHTMSSPSSPVALIYYKNKWSRHVNYRFHFIKFKNIFPKQVNFIHTLVNKESSFIIVIIDQQQNILYAYANAHHIFMQVLSLTFLNFLYLTHLSVMYCRP